MIILNYMLERALQCLTLEYANTAVVWDNQPKLIFNECQ